MYNTIKLKNYLQHQEEYVAVAAITPGMLLEITSAGKVQAHSLAGRTHIGMFAVEDELQGKTIQDAYAALDQVNCWIPVTGDVVYARLADGQNVIIGDLLESNGNGELRKVVRTNESWESADSQQAKSQYDHHIIGIALEAQDLSLLEGSESSADTNSQWIKVQII